MYWTKAMRPFNSPFNRRKSSVLQCFQIRESGLLRILPIFFSIKSIHRYPYYWKTPVSYFITSMVLLTSFSCGALIYACCIIFYYGACKFLVAFCIDFKTRVEALDRDFVRATSYDDQLPSVSYQQLKTGFNRLVDFHCEMKSLAERSSTVYKRVMGAFIITGGIFSGTNLFELHLVRLFMIFDVLHDL